MLRIHKQDEVQRISKEVGFRRRDRDERASKFLAEKPVKDTIGLKSGFGNSKRQLQRSYAPKP